MQKGAYLSMARAETYLPEEKDAGINLNAKRAVASWQTRSRRNKVSSLQTATTEADTNN